VVAGERDRLLHGERVRRQVLEAFEVDNGIHVVIALVPDINAPKDGIAAERCR
jgi:hypothetical protein